MEQPPNVQTPRELSDDQQTPNAPTASQTSSAASQISSDETTAPQTPKEQPWGVEEKTFNMLMHLAQLTSFIMPFAGLVLPVVMWATNKDKFPSVDEHGKNILNWMISSCIYFVVCFMLMFVVIGFVLIFPLIIINLVFIIIGAVKANDNIVWPYPLCIRFFK